MATSSLTAQRLREILYYDHETGIFTWRVRRGSRVSAGDVAGTPDKAGYTKIRYDRREYLAHRLAWLYMTGEWPDNLIDHKDTIKHHNWFDNLRQSDHSQNAQNQIRANIDNKTGLLGVSMVGLKARAKIKIRGKAIYLGLFDEPELAHAAYLAAKAVHHEFQTLTEKT